MPKETLAVYENGEPLASNGAALGEKGLAEARRIAANIAKFPKLVSRRRLAAFPFIYSAPSGALYGRSESRRLPREERLQKQVDTKRQNQSAARSWRRKVRRGFPDQGSLFRFASADKPPQTKRPRARRKRRIEE